jgi:hypothetical protein
VIYRKKQRSFQSLVCSPNYGAGFFGPSMTISVPNQPSDLSRSGGGVRLCDDGGVRRGGRQRHLLSD